MKELIGKILRRLKKEAKKFFKKINPKINIPDLGYTSQLDSSIRVAVVGLGPQGHKLTMYLHNMGYNIVAICDLNSKRRSLLKKKIPNEKAIKNIDELSKFNIDVCVLATLADSHLKLIEKLNSLGIKKILSEKPITNSMSDSFKLKKFINDNNIRIEVYHPALFSEEIIEFKENIANLKKGKLLNATLTFKPGGIGNIGSHVIATFLFLTGIKIKKIISSILSETDGISRGKKYYDPNGSITLLTEDDVTISINNSKEIKVRYQKIELNYENIIINIVDSKKLIVRYKKEINKDQVLIAKNANNNHLNRYKCLDNSLVKLITNDKSHSFSYALDAVEIIIASHLAYKNNESVLLPIEVSTPIIYNFS